MNELWEKYCDMSEQCYMESMLGNSSLKTWLETYDILKEALRLQSAGCFAVVLELMPLQSSQFITQRLRIPTIGIGGGKFCDGQVLVSDDLLGKYDRFKPKFARQYSSLKDIIFNVAKAYVSDVENGVFPSIKESFVLEDEEIEKLENYR